MLRKPPELEFVSMFATGECRWLKTGFPGQPGRPLVVMWSEVRLCRSLTAFHAWKPPEARIQYRANAIWPKSRTAGPGRPVFRCCSFDCLMFTAPPAFLGLAFRSWLECDKMPGKAEMISARARSASLARPDGRVLGHGCPFRSLWIVFVS